MLNQNGDLHLLTKLARIPVYEPSYYNDICSVLTNLCHLRLGKFPPEGDAAVVPEGQAELGRRSSTQSIAEQVITRKAQLKQRNLVEIWKEMDKLVEWLF